MCGRMRFFHGCEILLLRHAWGNWFSSLCSPHLFVCPPLCVRVSCFKLEETGSPADVCEQTEDNTTVLQVKKLEVLQCFCTKYKSMHNIFHYLMLSASSAMCCICLCFQMEALIKEVQVLREELRGRDKTIALLTLQCQQLQHQQQQRDQMVSWYEQDWYKWKVTTC